MSNSEVSIDEAIAYWESDETQLLNVSMGEFFTRHSITKVVYRQKTVNQDETAIEVIPHSDSEMTEDEIDLLSTYCRRFADNNGFNMFEAVQGVIYYSDSEVRFTGQSLDWSPLYSHD